MLSIKAIFAQMLTSIYRRKAEPGPQKKVASLLNLWVFLLCQAPHFLPLSRNEGTMTSYMFFIPVTPWSRNGVLFTVTVLSVQVVSQLTNLPLSATSISIVQWNLREPVPCGLCCPCFTQIRLLLEHQASSYILIVLLVLWCPPVNIIV